ncbi:hypothetical protein Glove_192g37 [Diversispora epigaea]|uniref:Uncharacterized protein n=1 Tax=Diversispora epigaea TaxID=1348612 RepID=A0A397IV39_9GLOM|nr:hypothetical protein Glove_192g37 [Diversispora epigaea]
MFTNGLQSISRMTAKEYRILMKVMVFVIDNLYKENKNNVEDFVENRKLSEVYAKWNKIYMMSRSEIFTESDLENFQEILIGVIFRKLFAFLQKQDSSLVGKIDDRLSKIPRFQKFQMFTNGLQSISRMTAKEYRILMKVMVFVIDNLYKENKNNVEDFVENRKLSEVYAKWNKIYMMSRSEIFTESDLENFQKDTFEWAKLFVEIFKLHSCFNLKFPKFYSWIYHIFESIRQFSAINGYTTETYESLHKDFLKRQDIINMINKKQKKKKSIKLLNFSLKLFETKLTEAYIYFCEKINDPNINYNMIKGFDQFLECFDDFLENILEIKDIKECDIIIYGTATLENGSIIRAKNKFHDKP